MLIYPNSMTFDIMEGGGIPPPPQGMLTIKVLRGDKLGSAGIGKIDPFVEVSFSLCKDWFLPGYVSSEAAAMPLNNIESQEHMALHSTL